MTEKNSTTIRVSILRIGPLSIHTQLSRNCRFFFIGYGYFVSFAYQTRYQMIEELSAGAVIFHDDPIRKSRMFLVLHYPAGHWDFPKGAVEKGETEEQAARREILEETGLRMESFVPNFKKQIEYHYRRQDTLAHKRVVFFLAKSNETKIRISFEHSGYDWLTFDQSIRRLTFENARNVLREANSWFQKEEASGRPV